MDNFVLKVRKFKCNDCDTISLIEFKQPLEGLYSCPICYEPMEYMDDLVVVQETGNEKMKEKLQGIKAFVQWMAEDYRTTELEVEEIEWMALATLEIVEELEKEMEK